MEKKISAVILENSDIALKEFNQSNLFEIKIEQLKKCPSIKEIVVVSNNENILLRACDLNIETVKIDDVCCEEKLSDKICQKIAQKVSEKNILFVNCAFPLIENKTLNGAIECYFENDGKYDSLNSAHLVKKYLLQNNKPLNFSEISSKEELPNIMALNFAINIISKETMLELGACVAQRAYLFEIDKIETTSSLNDFQYAEFMYKKLRMV